MEAPMTVVILAAGNGTRMGEYVGVIHKALLPVHGEAAISNIIRSYPPGTRFIIPIGPLGDQIEDYLKLAHPHDDWTTIYVDSSPLDSPGQTLLACSALIGDYPFEFTACDTIIPSATVMHFPTTGSWYGASFVRNSSGYDRLFGSSNLVVGVSRSMNNDPGVVFTGRARISETKSFFKLAEEHNSFSALLREYTQYARVKRFYHPWIDIGTIKRYRKVLEKDRDSHFRKDGEFRYEIDGRVIKWFEDETITRNRVRKAMLAPHLYPPIIGQAGNFYAYEWIEGQTLYECADLEVFKKFLDFMKENVWKNEGPLDTETINIFYNKKTKKRLAGVQQPTEVNGRKVNRFKSVGKHRGIKSPIHGDLQFANILYDGSRFTLIDWRQDFAGDVQYGDLYYDFAKLLGGLVVNFDGIGALSRFFYAKNQVIPFMWKPKTGRTTDYIAMLRDTAEKMGLDWSKVIDITGIIYLNMSGIHDNIELRNYFVHMGYLVLSRHDKTQILDF